MSRRAMARLRYNKAKKKRDLKRQQKARALGLTFAQYKAAWR